MKALKTFKFSVLTYIHHEGTSKSHIKNSRIVIKNSKEYKRLIETDDWREVCAYSRYYYK